MAYKYWYPATYLKLLRDPSKLLAVRKIHGKIELGEMEATGFAEACHQANVEWLVVRGISDFGDEFKDDRFHTYAATAAAAVLVDFMTWGLDLRHLEKRSISNPTGESVQLIPPNSAIDSVDSTHLTASDCDILADLLRRSGQANYSTRRAFCIKINVDPDAHPFMTAPPNAFALELVSLLQNTGNIEGLRKLCRTIVSDLHGSYATKLTAICTKLS